MKRVCFDTASNWFWDSRKGYLDNPVMAWELLGKQKYRFDCATVIDSETNAVTDVTDAHFLLTILCEADELISFNGRTTDLIVLQSCVGQVLMEEVWRKPHHDLKGWQGCQSLKGAAQHLLPRLSPYWQTVEDARLSTLTLHHSRSFITERLAGTYRDAIFTLELFRAYSGGGQTDKTYLDPSIGD